MTPFHTVPKKLHSRKGTGNNEWGWWWTKNPLVFAVPQNTTYINLLNTSLTSNTFNPPNTGSVVSVQHPYGPMFSGNGGASTGSNWVISGIPSSSLLGLTVGWIYTVTNVVGTENVLAIQSGSNPSSLNIIRSSGGFSLTINGLAGATIWSPTQPTLSTPGTYFVGLSYLFSGSYGASATAVIKDLKLGTTRIFKGVAANGGSSRALIPLINDKIQTTTIGSQAIKTGNGIGLISLLGGALNREQLVQWAQDPYGPFYPSKQSHQFAPYINPYSPFSIFVGSGNTMFIGPPSNGSGIIKK